MGQIKIAPTESTVTADQACTHARKRMCACDQLSWYYGNKSSHVFIVQHAKQHSLLSRTDRSFLRDLGSKCLKRRLSKN